MNTSALALSNTPTQTKKPVGDTYLKFKFGQQTAAALLMNRAQEVVVLPVERLTPMPTMPPHVMGLLNRRSRVMWVIDLARMLGLPGIEINVQHYNVIIISNGPATFGLIVQAVEGIVRLTPETIQSPLNQVSPGLVNYLQGCVLQEQEILLVIDAEAIIRQAEQTP